MSGPTIFVPNVGNVTVPSAEVSTPLMFLTPSQVHDINLALYLHIGATGVMIWDFLDNLRNDFTMPVTAKTRIPTIMYFVVRLTMVGYCIGRAVLLTLPVQNCQTWAQVLNVLLAFNSIFETGLCYLRVAMVYNRNPFIVAFFTCVWLTAVAMTFTIFKTFGAVHIPQTKQCRETVQGSFGPPTLATWVLNDSLIYFGTVYRIYKIFQTYDFGPRLNRRLAIMIFGASIPTIGSKIVLLESQLYCLIILISKITLLALVSIDMERHAMFLICHLVLVTILVSRVFRELMQTRDRPRQRSNTEFQTGNLTTDEFCSNYSISVIPQPKRSIDSQSSISAIIGPSGNSGLHDSFSNQEPNFPEEVHVSSHRHSPLLKG